LQERRRQWQRFAQPRAELALGTADVSIELIDQGSHPALVTVA
jgi:hypothetical protein